MSDCLTVFLPFSHPPTKTLKDLNGGSAIFSSFSASFRLSQPLAIVPLPALLPSSSSPPPFLPFRFPSTPFRTRRCLRYAYFPFIGQRKAGLPSSVHSLILFLFLPSATVNCQVHHADPVLSFIPTHRLFSFTMSAPGYYNGPPPPPQA